MSTETIVVDGAEYLIKPESEDGVCVGCAFHDDSLQYRCERVSDIHRCIDREVIFVKKVVESKSPDNLEMTTKQEPDQQTFTEAQVRAAYADWIYLAESGGFIDFLKNYSDPEFAEYQRLKAKFGG